jgi:hypothetical protein
MTQRKKKQPKQQYRGSWIPPEMMKLLGLGKVSALEVVLLAMIDSHVSEEQGCWAGNEYLALKMNTTEDWICRMISKLKKMGLVTQVAFDGRHRYLETEWSRMSDKARTTLQNRPGPQSEADLDQSPSNSTSDSKVEGHSMLEPDGSNSDSVESSSKNTKSPEKRSAGPLSSNSNNSKKGRKRKSKPSNFDKNASRKLQQVVESFRKVNKNSNTSRWPEQFRLIREEDGVSKDEIKKTLMWYEKNIGGSYIPVAYSARIFREKMQDGKFAAAMERSQNGNGNGYKHDKDDDEKEKRNLGRRVAKYLDEAGKEFASDCPTQEAIDEALVAMGLKPGLVDVDYV